MRGPGAAWLERRMLLGHRLLLDPRSHAQRRAATSGWFDDGLIRCARAELTAGTLALDIGANIGLWTLPLALRAAETGAHVVAVEPAPGNARQLAANVDLSGVADRVILESLALSDRAGSVELVLREDFVDGADSGNASVLIADGDDDDYPKVHVATARLDDLLDDDVVAVAKIDVEGHEAEVLQGARATLARSRPLIFAEWNTVYHDRRRTDPVAEVAAALDGLDYRTLRFAEGGWREQRQFHSPRPFDHLVLVPAERACEIASALPSDGPTGA